MALTVTPSIRTRVDKKFVVFGTITWDATYPAGGEAITANQCQLGTIEMMFLNPGVANFNYDSANSKILAYYGDYNAVADGLFIEIAVGDTALLSGVVTPFIAIGT